MLGPETSLRLVLVVEDSPAWGGEGAGDWPARPFHFCCEDREQGEGADHGLSWRGDSGLVTGTGLILRHEAAGPVHSQCEWPAARHRAQSQP